MGRGAALVFLVAVLAHAPSLFPGGPLATGPGPSRLVPDEGTVVYDAARIASGELMYRDFFEFQGPVFYHLTAASLALFGPSLTAARGVHLAVTAMAAALLFWLVAGIAGVPAGLGAAAIHVFLLVPVWPYHYPHWLAEALVLGGVVAATRARWLLAGALLALAVGTIQSLGLPVLIAVAVAPRSSRATLRVLAGAALVAVPITLSFAARGALGELVYAMWIWPFSHYGGGQEDSAGYAAYLGRYLTLHGEVSLPFRVLAGGGLVLVAALPVLGVLGGIAGGVRSLGPRNDATPVVPATALAALLPVLVLTRHDLTHLAFVGGVALLGAAALLRARLAGRALAVAGLLAAVSYGAKTVRTWEVSRAMGSWPELVRTLPNAAAIDRVVPAGAPIVVGNAGGFYYLYLRPAAVSHTYLPARAVGYLSEAQWQRIADEVAARRPALLQLIGDQWEELVRRRPELAPRYARPTPGVYVLRPGAP